MSHANTGLHNIKKKTFLKNLFFYLYTVDLEYFSGLIEAYLQYLNQLTGSGFTVLHLANLQKLCLYTPQSL